MEFISQPKRSFISRPRSTSNSLYSFQSSVAGGANFDPALEKLLQQQQRLSGSGYWSNELALSNEAAHLLNSEATSVTTTTKVLQATGKVGKKRSRASQRAPTTLLTTDIANFRAMVQQFTGLPESPCASLGSSSPHLIPTHNYSPFLIRDRMNSAPSFLPRAPPPPRQTGSGLQPFLIGGAELNPA
ncbi:hypothetical protein KI387_029408, partial [Taxus chinensis]